MEYLDFSSVITTIRKYINDERTAADRNLNEEVKPDQMHLLDQVFASFCDDTDSLDFAFDNGQVCRWFNGQQSQHSLFRHPFQFCFVYGKYRNLCTSKNCI